MIKTGQSTRVSGQQDGYFFVILVSQDFLAIHGDYRWTDTGYGNVYPCDDSWMDERLRQTGPKATKRLRLAVISALRVAVEHHNRRHGLKWISQDEAIAVSSL